MEILVLGLILFFTPHSVSMVNEAWRNRTAARLGEHRWQGVYSLVALTGFSLIIWGYGLARQDPVAVYAPPADLRHLTWLLMVPVFPLLIAPPIPGRIRAATNHPMLLATTLWAAAHLLANGNLADLLLFGTFLIWAAANRRSLTHRRPRPLPTRPPTRLNLSMAIIGGLGLYIAFLFGLHHWLIGVPLIR